MVCYGKIGNFILEGMKYMVQRRNQVVEIGGVKIGRVLDVMLRILDFYESDFLEAF